jgi:hypothetical protein
VIATATAVAIAMSSTVHAAEPEPATPQDGVSWGSEDEPTPAAAPAPVVTSAPTATPPSPQVLELRDRQRKAERIAISGYVVTGVGGLVCLLALPLLISARIEKNKEANFFQEAGDPESVRTKTHVGIGMIGAGLGVAIVGGVLIGVGLTRKRRHTRELEELTRPRAGATLSPAAHRHGGGVALVGWF